MILEQARATLTTIFAPLSIDRFFDDMMGKSLFELSGEPDHSRRYLLGADPAQTVLKAFATHGDQLACHAEAPTGPAPRALPVDSEEGFRASIRAFHERGYTVRIPDVTALSPTLNQFTRALEFMLHQPVKASLFWSANEARAPVHYDDNDNIIIQLAGRKRWHISSDPSDLHNPWRDVAEVQPSLGNHRTLDLNPGDFLYVPRGTPHTVYSQSESLHLSIIFTPVTLRDVVIAALDHMSDQNLLLRKGALGRVDASADKASLSRDIGDALERLLKATRSSDFIDSALQRRSSRTIGSMAKLTGGSPASALSPTSIVQHNPLAMCYMLATPAMIDFCYPGGHINIHRGVEAALRFISVTPSFRVADLPGEMPDEIRVALVERLMISGFLEYPSSRSI
ncbi:MAG: cupin domain-containing protein [Candidatus Sphingomonas colombiensis]|nr:cupin domain-containing protein [Sphingomonas sp.]WEK42465.1 MAG: cupin domain-containing protein [Sphingomonas sp.]